MTDLDMDALLGPPQVRRWRNASKIKEMEDISIPPLEVWNYKACDKHEEPTASCVWHKCGGEPFRHQRITSSFSYAARKTIVGNNTGTGKTLSALLTLALAHHYGEKVRALIVVPTTAVEQWHAETTRWVPGFKTLSIPSKTSKRDRLEKYAAQWNILIMGYHAFSRDIKHLTKVGVEQVVADDIDPALRTGNATFQALIELTDPASIVIIQNATSLQTHLSQLYAASALIGGEDVFGSEKNFMTLYVKRDKVWVTTGPEEKKRVYRAVGYQNLNHFKNKFDPMFVRFTYEDIADDIQIPDLMTEQVYLPMSSKQRTRYEELQTGVRTILNDKSMPANTKAVNALAAFTIGSQICAGTFALKTTSGGYEPDGDGASPKLDWIMNKLMADWTDEKVVVYAKFRGSITSLQGRLDAEDVKYSTIWGAVTDPKERQEEMNRFWQDPETRVMIISVSGERSLNLQNAKVIVMWDLQLNPARVTQIAGRVRRVGSTHDRVYVFQLLHENTQEDRYMAALSSRQALFDFVFEEDTEDGDDNMLIQKLDPEELLRLIRP